MQFVPCLKLKMGAVTAAALLLGVTGASAGAPGALPTHAELTAALKEVVDGGGNAGLGNEMWATVVDRSGVVRAVTFSGEEPGDQWPGSRVIAAQKAYTANAFSLSQGSRGLVPGLALSTANLYSAVQPGGTLFGLQLSNPVDPQAAYKGRFKHFGAANDPMVGERVGGINVFGGGLTLYDENGEVVGALGVSGDTSCSDHIIAWKVRDLLKLDYVPAGPSATRDDNMILDMTIDPDTGHAVSPSGFGHPACDGVGLPSSGIIEALPFDYPVEEIDAP